MLTEEERSALENRKKWLDNELTTLGIWLVSNHFQYNMRPEVKERFEKSNLQTHKKALENAGKYEQYTKEYEEIKSKLLEK